MRTSRGFVQYNQFRQLYLRSRFAQIADVDQVLIMIDAPEDLWCDAAITVVTARRLYLESALEHCFRISFGL